MDHVTKAPYDTYYCKNRILCLFSPRHVVVIISDNIRVKSLPQLLHIFKSIETSSRIKLDLSALQEETSRQLATKTDLFLKYIEEMYLKGTFEKDDQVMTNTNLRRRNILSGHSLNLARFFQRINSMQLSICLSAGERGLRQDGQGRQEDVGHGVRHPLRQWESRRKLNIIYLINTEMQETASARLRELTPGDWSRDSRILTLPFSCRYVCM